jgi:hypothetical protein
VRVCKHGEYGVIREETTCWDQNPSPWSQLKLPGGALAAERLLCLERHGRRDIACMVVCFLIAAEHLDILF